MHCSNADSLIIVTVEGIETLMSAAALVNAFLPIDVIPSGIVTAFMLAKYGVFAALPNASSAMAMTFIPPISVGMTTSSLEPHIPLIARYCSVISFSTRKTLTGHLSNASLAIAPFLSDRLSGQFALVSLVQPLNAAA